MIKPTLNIYNLLQECKVERDVEEKYKRIISNHFPTAKISSPYYTDGLLENDVKMLMEFKYDLDLSRRLPLVELLIQLIYYLKQFELHGDELPSIIFGGDVNECFCLHSNDLINYLNEDLDWSIAASEAASKNPELAKKLSDDQNIKPFIFSINNDHFDFKFVVDKIKQLHEGTVQKIRITELNISRFFSYFKDRIIKQKKKYNTNELGDIFLGCLIDPSNNYSHPKKKNTLVTGTVGEVSINGSLHDSFFDHFETSYSISEKSRLTEIRDRLLEDESRRFHGEFYTPTEWVLEAHKMIEDQFGLDWKEKYVVWDPAWGTGNLTRDFKFKELYCSTLHHGDLHIGRHYNPEAIKFQYDFLNDDVVSEGLLPIDKIKLPRGLVKAFEAKKPMIIFMNPPFGKATPISGVDGTGMAKNLINQEMIKQGFGISASQLYLQFLYRIIKFNKNINIAFYSPTMFLSSLSGNKFRDIFFKSYKMKSAFKFRADHFSNTSANWAIAFTLWVRGVEIRNAFNFTIKDFDDENKIINIGRKDVYYIQSNQFLSKWFNESITNKSAIETPNLNGPLSIKDVNNKLTINSIGAINNHANNQMQQRVIFIGSSALSLNGHKPIEKSNMMKAVSLYTARTSIPVTWINQKDEYNKPNEQHSEYKQWNTDAIIYSLFSGQSSMRKITYKDKIWDIKNEWFWMPNEQMLQLANENGFDELYHDANGDHDRFVFNKIKESSFSEDASEVLNKAIELVIKTFPYRQQLHEEHPEWHLHAWDAGWYQIKLILKKYFKDDLKEFNQLYKKFEDRMREGVYKFGFLK